MSGTFESNGISLSNNSIVFQYAGTYEIIYSLQIVNAHNAQEDVQVWFAKNGVDVPTSNSVFTIHSKTGNITGKIVMVTPFIVTVNAGDSIQIKWAAADTGVSIESLPPNITPTTPAAPGVIITVKQVMYTQVGPTGPTGTAGATGPIGPTGSGGAGDATDANLILAISIFS